MKDSPSILANTLGPKRTYILTQRSGIMVLYAVVGFRFQLLLLHPLICLFYTYWTPSSFFEHQNSDGSIVPFLGVDLEWSLQSEIRMKSLLTYFSRLNIDMGGETMTMLDEKVPNCNSRAELE